MTRHPVIGLRARMETLTCFFYHRSYYTGHQHVIAEDAARPGILQWRSAFGSGLLALWLASCSSNPSSPPMPHLSELTPTGPVIQRLQISSSQSEFQLTAVLVHDHERLQLAVLSPNGQRLFTLLRDENGTRYLPDSAISPPVTAPWLASRLSWALWPESSLESTFANTSWNLNTVGNRREIIHRHEILARILTFDTCTLIKDFQMKISMSISPLDSDRSCPPA